jgi:tungstate transport system substrate-binding protein
VLSAAFLLLTDQISARAVRDAGIGMGANRTIILATTTSTQDSGLLDYILPVFTAETAWNVDVVSVGTGAALQLGRDGQADVVLVHARAQEAEFVAVGNGLERFDVMYNDFIVAGPQSSVTHNNNVAATFTSIAQGNLPFVSRGDNSGTHAMELGIWKNLGVETSSLAKYFSVGQGMGATLQMAEELQAYTLTDRATWLKQKNMSLVVVCEKDAVLLNYYGVIAVNPEKDLRINAEGAGAFIQWILSPAAQLLIGRYGIDEFGGPLFTPNAQGRP